MEMKMEMDRGCGVVGNEYVLGGGEDDYVGQEMSDQAREKLEKSCREMGWLFNCEGVCLTA
jgi:hypothetical protein